MPASDVEEQAEDLDRLPAVSQAVPDRVGFVLPEHGNWVKAATAVAADRQHVESIDVRKLPSRSFIHSFMNLMVMFMTRREDRLCHPVCRGDSRGDSHPAVGVTGGVTVTPLSG